MKTVEVAFLDGEFDISIERPTTLSEMTSATGFTEEMTVDEAVDNIYYRNTYPRIYREVSAELEKKGFPRAVASTKTNRDGTVKHVHESVNDHIRAALIGRKAEDKSVIEGSALIDGKNILQSLFAEIAPTAPLYVKGERVGGGGKVSEQALTASNGFFAEGATKVEAVADYIEARVPGYKVARDPEGEVTPESLARAISALNKKAAKDAADAQKAALGALAGV